MNNVFGEIKITPHKIKKKRNNEEKITNILIFLLILFGYNTMITANFIGDIGSLIMVSILVLFKIIYNVIVLKKQLSFNKKLLIVSVFLMINILITMVFNSDAGNGNYLLVLKIWIAVLVVSNFKVDLFKRAYTNSMFFFSIYSIVCTYLLANIFIKNFVPQFNNVTGLYFYNFIFAYVLNFPDYYRNFGIFTEPGMYVCYIIPALIFEISDNSIEQNVKTKLLRIIVFIIALISTFSTVGIIAAFVLVYIYILFNKTLPNKSKKVITILFIIGIMAISSNQTLSKSFDDSINKLTQKESSYIGRSYVLQHNIKVWLSSPLIGKGLTNVTQVINIEKLQKISSSNTSTTTIYLAVYGLFFGITHFISLYNMLKIKRSWYSIIYFLVFLFAINSQALFHSELLWYLSFYGVMCKTSITK